MAPTLGKHARDSSGDDETAPPAKRAVSQPPEPTIPGIKAEQGLAAYYRREIQTLLAKNNDQFPGAQPVSFASHHIDALRRADYYVCEKSDGIRCLLYCSQDENGSEIHYLIDRKNDYYFVQSLHFPMADAMEKFHVNTLVDGELVMDRQDNGEYLLHYLVFDCLVVDNISLMQRTLDKRLGYFRERFFKPYEEMCRQFPQELKYFPFTIELKKMELSYGIEMLFRNVLPNLRHGNDGLIFTCKNTAYKFGTDENILKWKPANENSIDFQLRMKFRPWDSVEQKEVQRLLEESGGDVSSEAAMYDYGTQPELELWVYHGNQYGIPKYERWGEMKIDDDVWEAETAKDVPMDRRIVECSLDENKKWLFKRFRDDKSTGNHISTVTKVMDSIQDGVTQEDLIAAAQSIRTAWKAREEVEKQRQKQLQQV